MSQELSIKQNIRLSSLPLTNTLRLTIEPQSTIVIEDDSSIETIHLIVKHNAHVLFTIPRTNQNAMTRVKTLVFELAEEGAEIVMHCLSQIMGDKKHTYKTLQHHKAPHTKSSLIIKSVVHDQGQLLCNSLIRIEKQAQHSEAREENKNLLLSDNARVITIPKLEVEANDVSCSHGAAISRPDKLTIFYLQTRGISNDQAEQILIDAFLKL